MTDAIYPYHMGGKEVRYEHVIAGLAGHGLEVHVFTMHWWQGPRHKVENGVHYHALCKMYPLYNDTQRSMREAVMFALACVRLVFYRFDVLEADHMPHLPLFTVRLVALLRRVPLVVTWHEYWGSAYWREYLGRLGPLAAAVEWLTMRLGTEVITPSPATAARLIDKGIPARRVTIVPNGLDLAAIEAAPAARDHVELLYVGRLLEHKHVDLLIDALAALRDEGVTVSCALVGEGPERARLAALVERHQLSEKVTFLGNLEHQGDIFGLMKSASVFVLPSTREGFGIVVAEALACGCPVVTIDHPDNQARTLVEDGVTGWLCEATAPSLAAVLARALATELARPLIDPKELAELDWGSRVATIVEILGRSNTVGR